MPLVINSTGPATDFACRTISLICGWVNGSPNPPKVTLGGAGKARKPAMTCSKTPALMSPCSSSQLLRMQVRQVRLQRLVGSM